MLASLAKKGAFAVSTMAVASTAAFADVSQVPALKETIRKGHIIQAEDITWIKPAFNRVSPLVITNVKELIGKQALRTIRPEAPVLLRSVRTPPTVARSEEVTLRHVTAGISLEMTARALEDGALHEKIRVLNTSSGRVLQAEIIEPGLVQLIN